MLMLRAMSIALATAALLAVSAGSLSAQSPEPSTDAPVAPAWVNGTLRLAPSCSGPDVTIDGIVERQRNYRCAPQTWTTDDPRFTGTAISTWNADVYRVDGASVSVTAGTYEVTTEGGTWSCGYADGLANGSGLFTGAVNDETITCVGAGGYADLMAIVVLDWTASPVSITGLIVPGELTPSP